MSTEGGQQLQRRKRVQGLTAGGGDVIQSIQVAKKNKNKGQKQSNQIE